MSTRLIVCGDYIEIYTTRISNKKKPPQIGLSLSQDKELYSKKLSHQSYHRAKNNVKRILLTNLSGKKNTDIFFTLTYAQTMLDYSQAQKDFNRFRSRARKHGFDFPYIVISENQIERGIKEGNNGTIHHHGVFFGTGKIDIKKLSSIWNHGFIFLEYIKFDKPPIALALYMTKYLTKQRDNQKHTKYYRTSYNLKRPIEYKSNNLYIEDINIPFKVLYKSEYVAFYSEPVKYRLCSGFGGIPPKLKRLLSLTIDKSQGLAPLSFG